MSPSTKSLMMVLTAPNVAEAFAGPALIQDQRLKGVPLLSRARVQKELDALDRRSRDTSAVPSLPVGEAKAPQAGSDRESPSSFSEPEKDKKDELIEHFKQWFNGLKGNPLTDNADLGKASDVATLIQAYEKAECGLGGGKCEVTGEVKDWLKSAAAKEKDAAEGKAAAEAKAAATEQAAAERAKQLTPAQNKHVLDFRSWLSREKGFSENSHPLNAQQLQDVGLNWPRYREMSREEYSAFKKGYRIVFPLLKQQEELKQQKEVVSKLPGISKEEKEQAKEQILEKLKFSEQKAEPRKVPIGHEYGGRGPSLPNPMFQ